MPHFDYSISLGSVLSLLGAVATAIAVIATFKTKIDTLLALHSEQLSTMRLELKEHRIEDDKRFEAMNERLFDIVASLQRLIGQITPGRSQ